MRFRVLGLLLVCGAASSACGAILGVDFGGAVLAGEESGVAEGGDGATPDATADRVDTVDAGDARVDSSTPGCASARGPKMVHVDDDAGGVHFCIDSTEVSSADYLAFVDAVSETDLKALGSSMPRVCKERFARAPDAGPLDVATALQKANVSSTGTRAVTNIGWCQAHAYCAWAGKRMCGSQSACVPLVM